MQPDLRLDPDGLDRAAARAATLAADLDALARRARDSLDALPPELPADLDHARRTLTAAVEVMTRTSGPLRTTDRHLARRFHEQQR
jgi:hypothetical protein